MGKIEDITRQRFGRLVAISRCTWTACNGGAIWNCLCDCGNWTEVSVNNLKRGSTTSCGCYGKECRAISLKEKLTTHELAGSPTYKSWSAMIQRCTNPPQS